MAVRDAPVGGQAVLEGVMMRGVSTWAVAVREPVAETSPNGASNGATAHHLAEEAEIAAEAAAATLAGTALAAGNGAVHAADGRAARAGSRSTRERSSPR